MDKNILTITIIALISAFVWIGITVYSANTKVEINPNASTYTAALDNTFDRDTITQIQGRVDNNLPIKTDVYKNLKLPDIQPTPTPTPTDIAGDVTDTTSVDNTTPTDTPTPTL
jgi:hypothetical protein